MRKALIVVALILGFSAPSKATDPTTARLGGLDIIPLGSPLWGPKVNANMYAISTAAASQINPNSFTSSNTFLGALLASGTSFTLTGPNGWIVSGSSVQASAFFGDGSNLTALNGAQITTGTLPAARIGAASIDTTKLANAAVGTNQIAPAAVDTTKLASGAAAASIGGLGGDLTGTLPSPSVASLAITTAKLAAGSVDTSKLSSGAAAASVGGLAGDLTGTLPSPSIAALAVSTSKLAALAVDTSKLAADAVTNSKILAGSVDTAKIAASGVAAATYGSSGLIPVITVTSDGRITGGSSIAPAITNSMLASGSVDTAKLATDSVSGIKILAAAVDTNKLASGAAYANLGGGSIDTTRLAADSVTAVKILAGSIDTSKMASGAVIASIGAGQIDTTKLATDSVTGVKIIAAAIDTNKLASGSAYANLGGGSIDTSRLATDSVTAIKISAGAADTNKIGMWAVDTTKIQTDAVIARTISAGAVDTNKVGMWAIDTTKIQTDAVVGRSIKAGSVDTAKLAASGVAAATYGSAALIPVFTVAADGRITGSSSIAPAITNAMLGSGIVDTNKIATDAVGSAQILAGSVNTAKLAVTGVAAGSCGDATHSCAVTFTTDGRATAATTTLITGAAPTGAAGGDLTGNYPNPTAFQATPAWTAVSSASVNGASIFRGASSFQSTATFNSLAQFTNSNSTQAVFSGQNSYSGTRTDSGNIAIGAAATFRGSIQYDGNSGNLHINNTWDNAGGATQGNIQLGLRTAGTEVVAVRMDDSEGVVFFPSAVTSTMTIAKSGLVTMNGQAVFANSSSSAAIFKGFDLYGGAGNSDLGLLQVGGNTAFSGVIDYDGNAGVLHINNTYDNTAGNINFGVRTAGTPLTPLVVSGLGGGQSVFNNTVSTSAIFKGYSEYTGASSNSGHIKIGNSDSNAGVLDYEGGGGILYIQNSYDAAGGNIVFKTRTQGTANTPLTITGAGAVSVNGSTFTANLAGVISGPSQPGAHASLNSDLTIPASVATHIFWSSATVSLNASNYNVQAQINIGTSSDTFRCISSGFYAVGCCVTVTRTAGSRLDVGFINQNSDGPVVTNRTLTTETGKSYCVNDIIKANSGDTFFCNIYSDTAATIGGSTQGSQTNMAHFQKIW